MSSSLKGGLISFSLPKNSVLWRGNSVRKSESAPAIDPRNRRPCPRGSQQ